MRLIIVSLWLWLALPTTTYAAVIFSEIAWMGSVDSANDEWIEIYNFDSAPVDLTGWEITDGLSLTIPLSGTLNPHEVAVLERTDDDSAPGTAFLIYTGALANDGATLTIKRPDGSIEDQIVGGVNWEQIGGDNETKNTAGLVGREQPYWTTTLPTPGATNVEAVVDETPEQTDQESNDSSDSGSGNKTTPLTLPDVTLSLFVDIPEMIYVNQPIALEVEPSGLGEVIMDSLVYDWNFGDLKLGSGKKVTHTYTNPGEYVLTVRGAYARHDEVAKMTVTVLPVNVTLEKIADGNYLIRNNSRYEIDISNYTIYGTKSVSVPPRTYLLPNATLFVPKKSVRPAASLAVNLFDGNDQKVASYKEREEVQILTATEEQSQTAVATLPPGNYVAKPTPKISAISSDKDAKVFAFNGDQGEVGPEVIDLSPVTPVAQLANVPLGSSKIPEESLPYLGLIGLLGIGILAVYKGKK